jgi:hypothetical protein
MTIDASCPNCGTVFTLRRDLIGKRTKCTRCGTPFVITEMPARPIPSAGPPPPDQGIPDIPLHQLHAPQSTSSAEAFGKSHLSHPRNHAGELFGFEQDPSRPRFPALRIVARAYEVMAGIGLVIAVGTLIVFLVTVIREPSAFLSALVSSGFAFFWMLATSLMFLFVSQAIRLGLQIEQNTRETQQACRQLTDHLTAIQTEQ